MEHDFGGAHILVLGAAGYIGRELCRGLVSMGARVTGYDRVMPEDAWLRGLDRDRLDWVSGDLSEREKLLVASRDIDYVFHLVSTTIPDTSNKDLPFDLLSNVIPTIQLLDVLKDRNLRKLVFISSGGTVYGIPRTIPIPEHHETDPICGYGIHKLAIEKYLNLYNYNHGLDHCILRLSNPYSPSQISDRPQGAIGKFVYKALRHEPIEIWGDGSVVRDYVYMDDVLEAFYRAMEYRGDKHIFNVGSGTGHSLTEIAEVIEEQQGRPLDIRFLPSRPADVPLNVLDISRIRSEFLWAPTMDIHSGIRRMLEDGQRT